MSGGPTATVFLLGPLAGISGGDVHAVRLVDHWHRDRPGSITLLAPPALREQLPEPSHPALRPVRTPLDDRLLPMPAYVLNVSVRALLALARAPHADVAVAASHFFQDVIPCVVRGRRHGALVVAYVYHLVAEERPPADLRSRVSIRLERFSLALLRRARALVFVDNARTADALAARGFRRQDIHMTGNAYDPCEPLPERAPPERPTLVFCGRLTEEKGVWDALEIARRLPDVRLVMLGDGPLRGALRQQVAGGGLDNVELRGFVSETEKWQTLRAASAFLAPSREEGWGIAVGEALTAGLPVVAYDLPAYSHFGDRLDTVATSDVGALAKTAGRVLEASRDAHLGPGLPQWRDILARERDAIERAVLQ